MTFSDSLLEWYEFNKRDLPWRETFDVYKIWISEIILQQTKVIQGIPYYLKFINHFPTIHKLSLAKEDEVLKVWEGLGYYSRARNMHYTAKYLVDNFDGNFPRDYKELLALKGIGPYTAAAISSIAFKLPYAVVDGNVIRVLSRFHGISIPYDTHKGKRIFQQLAQELLNLEKPDVYNQAIMDFGATQCKPKLADCNFCALNDSCFAFKNNIVDSLPVRSKKKKIKNRYIHFLIIQNENDVYIKKREKGIWKGLYEFPFIEVDNNVSLLNKRNFFQPLFKDDDFYIESVSKCYSHRLSHQHIFASFWRIKSTSFISDKYIRIAEGQLRKNPLPVLILNYLKDKDIK